MFVVKVAPLVLVVTVGSALTANLDPVILKQSDGLRFGYQDDGEGNLHLLDQRTKVSNLVARFNPDVENTLHLFTRQNPSVSQPMLLNSDSLLASSNFNPRRRTVIIVHGWTQSATSNVNAVLIPAFLVAAEEFNVFAYDWSKGAGVLGDGPNNAVASGRSLARAIDWICARTGTTPARFHILGFSLGAHLSAIAGRNVQSGTIAYITALDPGANMEDSGHMFGPDAAAYTEAIHTNAGIMGHGTPLAHVDFYPNGGDLQPGCGVNLLCNHYRSFQFFAETIQNAQNWSGVRCGSYTQARLGLCVSLNKIRMGGLVPKTGSSGLYHLKTNAEPPFQPVRE